MTSQSKSGVARRVSRPLRSVHRSPREQPCDSTRILRHLANPQGAVDVDRDEFRVFADRPVALANRWTGRFVGHAIAAGVSRVRVHAAGRSFVRHSGVPRRLVYPGKEQGNAGAVVELAIDRRIHFCWQVDRQPDVRLVVAADQPAWSCGLLRDGRHRPAIATWAAVSRAVDLRRPVHDAGAVDQHVCAIDRRGDSHHLRSRFFAGYSRDRALFLLQGKTGILAQVAGGCGPLHH